MRNVIMLVFLFLGMVVISAHAEIKQYKAPKNQAGDEIRIGYGGVRIKMLTGTAEVLVSSGQCLFYGVVFSSSAVSQFVVIRDTNVIANSGTQILPDIDLAASASSQYLIVGYPVRHPNGITAKLSAANNGGVGILYIRQD